MIDIFFGAVTNVLVILSSMQLVSATGIRGNSARLVLFGQFWAALIIGSTLILGGAFERLSLFTLLITHLLIFGIALGIGRQNPARQLRNSWNLLIAQCQLCRSEGILISVGAVLVLVAYIYVFFIGVLLPPAAEDTLMYHLPIAMSFIQQESLQVPQLSPFWNANHAGYFVSNGSLLMAWVLMTAGETFVNLVQLPFVGFSAAAIFALCRSLGLPRSFSILGALLFASMPIVINQSATAMIDLMVAFYVIATVLWIFSLRSGEAWKYAFLIAMPAAMLFGTKYTALVYLGFLALLGLVSVSLQKSVSIRDRFNTTLICLLATALAMILLGGYWYLRNFLEVGDAVYPTSLLGSNKTSMNFSTPPLEYFPLVKDFLSLFGKSFYNYQFGAGVQIIVFVVPALMLVFVRSVFRHHWILATLSSLCLLGYLVWWLLGALWWGWAPESNALRYAIPWLAIGIVLSLWLLHSIGASERLWRPLMLVMIFHSTLLALPVAGSNVDYQSLSGILDELRRTGSMPGVNASRARLRVYDFRDGWEWLERNTSGADIAAVNQAFSYPLFGVESPGNRLHFLDNISRATWLDNIERKNISYVITSPVLVKPEILDTGTRNISGLGSNSAVTMASTARMLRAESFGMNLPLDQSNVQEISVTYAITFYTGNPTQLLKEPTGRIFLSINGGRIFRELDVSWRGLGESKTINFPWDSRTVISELGFVYSVAPITRLNARSDFVVSSIDLRKTDGSTVELPLRADQWQPLIDPVEESWMRQLPGRFRLVHESVDRLNADIYPEYQRMAGTIRIYEVQDGFSGKN